MVDHLMPIAIVLLHVMVVVPATEGAEAAPQLDRVLALAGCLDALDQFRASFIGDQIDRILIHRRIYPITLFILPLEGVESSFRSLRISLESPLQKMNDGALCRSHGTVQ